MARAALYFVAALYFIAALALSGCDQGWGDDAPPYDSEIEIPRTESFAPSLSAYGIYLEPMVALQPTDRAIVYELSSELFTDYARKQRLLMVPEGSAIARMGDDGLVYPEGTVLVKTFYYPADARDPDGPIRIIETRLLVKTATRWNVATYLWNAEQTDATLLLEGTTTAVSWTDEAGRERAIDYAVPHEGECVTCHQSGGRIAFIGPSVANLNRAISRGGATVNQLADLEARGLLGDGAGLSSPALPDDREQGLPLEARARAYLHVNCAHCHNPDGWDAASDRRFDLRYSTPLDQSGIARKADEITRVLENGEMPYLGTTLPHEAGIQLVVDYLGRL